MHWFALIFYNLVITMVVYNLLVVTLMDGLLSIFYGYYHIWTRLRRFVVNLVGCGLAYGIEMGISPFVHIQNYGEYIAQRYLIVIGILLSFIIYRYTYPLWRTLMDQLLPIQLMNIHTYDDEFKED